MGWNNPPTPRWNASESPVIARRCPPDISSTTKGRHPKGGVGLKSAPGDPPRIFQQVESETSRSR